jgi:hypothetical protein
VTPVTDLHDDRVTESSVSGLGAALTLTEAAKACGVSHSTIKRRLSEFANAQQNRSGVWQVPVADLLGAGFHLRPRAVEPVTEDSDPGHNGSDLAQAQARIEELTTKLADERVARSTAEALAAERAARIEDLRYSLRALSGPPRPPEATPAPVPPEAPQPVQSAPALAPARRGWWSRLWARE